MHLTCQAGATIACQLPARNEMLMMHALVSPLRTDFGKVNVVVKTRRGGRDWLFAKVAGQDDDDLRDLVSATRELALVRQAGFVQDQVVPEDHALRAELAEEPHHVGQLVRVGAPGGLLQVDSPRGVGRQARAPGHGGHLGGASEVGGCGDG